MGVSLCCVPRVVGGSILLERLECSRLLRALTADMKEAGIKDHHDGCNDFQQFFRAWVTLIVQFRRKVSIGTAEI